MRAESDDASNSSASAENLPPGYGQLPPDVGDDDNDAMPFGPDNSDADDDDVIMQEASIGSILDQQDDDSWGLGSFDFDDEPDDLEPADKMSHDFKQYVAEIVQHHKEMNIHQCRSVRLMHLLRRKGATLDTYDATMKWHLEESGDKNPHHFISRYKLIKFLKERYGIPKDFTKQKEITLPSSGARVNVIYFEAKYLVRSLLTDPRFGDDDWLHFNDDPLAPPPDDLNYVADVNTGLSYTETYKKLITNPAKQMLVPIILYMDGAVTGQFDKLQVEALKMTLGILKQKARVKEYAWRVLGKIRCLVQLF
jgi:hypothetical protein